jgi:hypothetical protein
MATNNHELAQSIAEAVMKQFSNFKSEFNAEAVASAVYNVLNTETCFDMPNELEKPSHEWDKTPEQIVNERDAKDDICWDTDCTLNMLSSFIEHNTSQKDFEKHIDEVAKADIALLSVGRAENN